MRKVHPRMISDSILEACDSIPVAMLRLVILTFSFLEM
jgi:hypothetical protein